MWSKIVTVIIGSMQSRKLFRLPEIMRPWAAIGYLALFGLLQFGLSQIDVIARRLPKKRNSRGTKWRYVVPKEHATSTDEREKLPTCGQFGLLWLEWE